MDAQQGLLLKSLVFGAAFPLVTKIAQLWVPAWMSWGIGAALAALLFYWLPPRVHAGLTIAKSLVLSLLAGAAAIFAVLLVEKLL